MAPADELTRRCNLRRDVPQTGTAPNGQPLGISGSASAGKVMGSILQRYM